MAKISPLLLLLLFADVWATPQNTPPITAVETPASREKPPFLGGFLKETRIVYPLKLGKWTAVGEHLYEQQELGVSVRYASSDHQDRWIDLYFYPAGVLSDEQFKDVADSERELILQMEDEPGGYESVDIGGLQRFSAALPEQGRNKERIEGYVVDMSFAHKGETRNSAMTLLLDRLYFVKGRFSIADNRMSRRKARRLLEEFMGELSPRLQIVSSGQCWMPLPIEKLDAAAPSLMRDSRPDRGMAKKQSGWRGIGSWRGIQTVPVRRH